LNAKRSLCRLFRHFYGLAPLETTQIQRFGERECDRILFMFDHNATIAP
jgi:hypothetical protein